MSQAVVIDLDHPFTDPPKGPGEHRISDDDRERVRAIHFWAPEMNHDFAD